MSGLQSIKKVTERKAKELKAKALQSVATLSGEIPSLMVSHHCKSIMQLNKEIEKLKGVLIARCEI